VPALITLGGVFHLKSGAVLIHQAYTISAFWAREQKIIACDAIKVTMKNLLLAEFFAACFP